MQTLAQKLRDEHDELVRLAENPLVKKDKQTYWLYYGRAQGLELAMREIGIDFTPIAHSGG